MRSWINAGIRLAQPSRSAQSNGFSLRLNAEVTGFVDGANHVEVTLKGGGRVEGDHPGFDTEALESIGAVGPDQERGADLAQIPGALEHLHLQALPAEGNAGGQPADSRPGNQRPGSSHDAAATRSAMPCRLRAAISRATLVTSGHAGMLANQINPNATSIGLADTPASPRTLAKT